VTLSDIGISWANEKLFIDWREMGKTIVAAFLLVGIAIALEQLFETFFIVDFRFVFAFASDLTAYRALMFFLYFPLLFLGFLILGFFLHGQLRQPLEKTPQKTFLLWTLHNLSILLIPLGAMLAMQYVPLFATGTIPFVGPGGMFVLFMINLMHVTAVLAMVIPLSTWFFMLTGRTYLGSFVSAGIVAWMFTSSQVIAPVPI
jgi:hypothetical protein